MVPGEILTKDEDIILNACEEMEYYFHNKNYLNTDEYLENKFNKTLIKYNGYGLNKSKISYFYLNNNSQLFD